MHAEIQVAILQKLWPILKFDANQQTNQQTGQNQKGTLAYTGEHKKLQQKVIEQTRDIGILTFSRP
jgi:hypothetical protein